jgi:hypothetical protein
MNREQAEAKARPIRNRLDGINTIYGDEQRALYLEVITDALLEVHRNALEEAEQEGIKICTDVRNDTRTRVAAGKVASAIRRLMEQQENANA